MQGNKTWAGIQHAGSDKDVGDVEGAEGIDDVKSSHQMEVAAIRLAKGKESTTG
jgi:hypothetical protein